MGTVLIDSFFTIFLMCQEEYCISKRNSPETERKQAMPNPCSRV